MTDGVRPPRASAWFAARGWRPFPFQRQVWREMAAGHSGLLHATTGAGKTYAIWLAALQAFAGKIPAAFMDAAQPVDKPSAERARRRAPPAAPLAVLWITPMRALAADTARALEAPLPAMAPHWQVGLRTGDTGSAERARQSRRLPTALVTTPESLTLLLARTAAHEQLAQVRLVVVDEWHELLGNKRGVQTQLALARLARMNPALQVWGLSATLGDLELAADALLRAIRTPRVLVRGNEPKRRIIDTLVPNLIERFPWAGHLGLRLVEATANEVASAQTSLLFTNTRSQAELWYQALLAARPEWAGVLALHHGSLDASVREWVELGLKEGRLKAVVCTSSLDLGVDFPPVDRVFQIGSPKGVARLLQRAGRAGHAPGRVSRVTLVPTHALELIEAAAARHAAAEGRIEARHPPESPFDVLVQHLVTMAIGGGFKAPEMLEEVRSAWSFRHLSEIAFDWALAFVERGGASLAAYPEYHRVLRDEHGIYRVPREDLARRHLLNIGTIVSDASMRIEWLSGGRIGSVEETFIARLRPGDVFTFSGRVLELVRVREMTAYVRRAKTVRGIVPRWQGGRMPLSSELADATLARLAAAARGDFSDPEVRAVQPLITLQMRWSHLPEPGMLLVELLKSREGWHFFCYPFAGRSAHTGLGSLLAWRAARHSPITFSIAANDYGFELLSATPVDWPTLIEQGLFSIDALEADVVASLNASQLSQRRFREISRIAGLVTQRFPGAQKSARQLQASSGLFFEVFSQYDPDNLLLAQAATEVLLQELDIDRLRAALLRIADSALVIERVPRPTPFAFPLMIERMRERVSTESLGERVARMLEELERAANIAVDNAANDMINHPASANASTRARARSRRSGSGR
ncbi:MAG: ligase-associated DNA damage response DEXH box helicase [Janthinobacterium lividum]